MLTAVGSLGEEEGLARRPASVYFASEVAIGGGEGPVATRGCLATNCRTAPALAGL